MNRHKSHQQPLAWLLSCLLFEGQKLPTLQDETGGEIHSTLSALDQTLGPNSSPSQERPQGSKEDQD